MQPGRCIGGARAACHHADAGTAGEFTLRLGHHRGAAFLAADGGVDGRIVQSVQHGQKALARHGEYLLGAVDHQLVHHQLAASALDICLRHIFVSLLNSKKVLPHAHSLRVAAPPLREAFSPWGDPNEKGPDTIPRMVRSPLDLRHPAAPGCLVQMMHFSSNGSLRNRRSQPSGLTSRVW
ncbi:hypothetical protein D3C72_1756330 [compost metagenome]